MVEESNFAIIYNHPLTLSLFDIKIQNENPFNIKGLTKDIADTLNGIGRLLKRSYKVKTLVEVPKETMVLTKVQPVTGELERGRIDLDIGKTAKYKARAKGYFDEVCKGLISENRKTDIIPKCDGFSVLHILEKKFNPEATKLLIEATENLVLYSFNQRHRITKSEICPHYLEHDIEIIQPQKELYY